MLESIVQLDKELMIFLNNLGSVAFDPFWLFVTKQLHWIPFYIIVLYFLQRKIGWKNLGITLVFVALLITFTNVITDVFKYGFERLRPCNDPSINQSLRFVTVGGGYSFFSGHASNSMATMLFIFLVLRKYYKFAFLVFIFPLVFAYSRIYLGLHFPFDVITGYAFGALSGFLFYKLYKIVQAKLNLQNSRNG